MTETIKKMDLLNNLSEILEHCRNYREPVIVSNNGEGRFAVMTEETYEELIGKSRNELYNALQMGLDQINNGDFITGKDFFEFLDNLE
jgi:PHD/YefM family antitoxin component YafN of YafNO toxin-antitoxin module